MSQQGESSLLQQQQHQQQKSMLHEDFEFYARRLRADLERQSCDVGEAYVPASVFEEIILHLSRRLDNFEQRLVAIERSNLFCEDMTKLIREEYKQVSIFYRTHVSEAREQKESHERRLADLESAFIEQRTYSQDQQEQIHRFLNQKLSEVRENVEAELGTSSKTAAYNQLRMKELEILCHSLKQEASVAKFNEKDISQHQKNEIISNVIQKIKTESTPIDIKSNKASLEREVEWIKQNLIKVIDLIIQQQDENE